MTFRIHNTRAAKATGEMVVWIRERYTEGWSQGRLSRETGLGIGQIGRIVRNEAWKQLPQIPTDHEAGLRGTVLGALPEVQKAAVESLAKLDAMLASPRAEREAGYGAAPQPVAQPASEADSILDRMQRDIRAAREAADQGLKGLVEVDKPEGDSNG